MRCENCGSQIVDPPTIDQHAAGCPQAIHYVAVRPDDDQEASPGRRLRIQQDDPSDLVVLSDETTLPESVARVDARHKKLHDSILLTEEESIWMRNRFVELKLDDQIYVALTAEEWRKIILVLHVVSDVTATLTVAALERQVAK